MSLRSVVHVYVVGEGGEKPTHVWVMCGVGRAWFKGRGEKPTHDLGWWARRGWARRGWAGLRLLPSWSHAMTDGWFTCHD